jgi:regulator of RNase E activity RraA
MSAVLPGEKLQELRRISTPTIANAIETFNIRSRAQGFMNSDVRSVFPDLGVMVGYACTATIRAEEPAAAQNVSRFDYWDALMKIPAPRIAVIQDLDQPRPVGSFWGEVNASIHKALGCVGTVTNGGVRDLEEVHKMGFHFFASAVLVSHAYVHLVDIGVPVNVGGVVVKPGDLIHGDRHGVIIIPHEIAGRVADAAKKVESTERPIIDYCNSSGFTLEGLKHTWIKVRGKP